VVSNALGVVTSSNATLTVTGLPPIIVVEPASQSVAIGASVTLSVSAQGTAPLSYQWRKDDTVILGATSASYALANAQTNDAGVYSAVVSNAFGSVSSSNATLRITIPARWIPSTQGQTPTLPR